MTLAREQGTPESRVALAQLSRSAAANFIGFAAQVTGHAGQVIGSFMHQALSRGGPLFLRQVGEVRQQIGITLVDGLAGGGALLVDRGRDLAIHGGQ